MGQNKFYTDLDSLLMPVHGAWCMVHARCRARRCEEGAIQLSTKNLLVYGSMLLSTSIHFLFFSFLFFSDRVRPQFVLVKLPLSCDHNWIRSGPVNNVR